MANIGREMSNRPSASLSWGRNLGQESLKALPNQKQLSTLKTYLKEQNPTEKIAMLKKGSKDIILNEDTIGAFFDKLAESVSEQTSIKESTGTKPFSAPKLSGNKGTSKVKMPGLKQYTGVQVASAKGSDKYIRQNPIG